jgi:hypothetical protein
MSSALGQHDSQTLRRTLAGLLIAGYALLAPVSDVLGQPPCGADFRTVGVNYDPRVPLPPGSLGLSSATLSFRVFADFGGQTIELASGT